jgi:hypothetical protein
MRAALLLCFVLVGCGRAPTAPAMCLYTELTDSTNTSSVLASIYIPCPQ